MLARRDTVVTAARWIEAFVRFGIVFAFVSGRDNWFTRGLFFQLILAIDNRRLLGRFGCKRRKPHFALKGTLSFWS